MLDAGFGMGEDIETADPVEKPLGPGQSRLDVCIQFARAVDDKYRTGTAARRSKPTDPSC